LEKFELGFGQHLMLDGYGCPHENLTDLDRIYEFLNQCPDLIHMTKIMPPYAFKYSGKVPQDWGLSGFVLIAESHISIHTFPEKGYLSIDVFSCKDFDVQTAVDFATKVFGITSQEIKIVDRGLEFPRDMGAVTQFMTDERKEMRA
jgi:S-adenosylmethionine decarboxylase